MGVMSVILRAGQAVELSGVVQNVTPRSTRLGEVFVKGSVRLEDGTAVRCVWWDARTAPRAGSRVRMTGEVRTYQGEPEVHVRQTVRLGQDAGGGELEHRLLRFYVACLEAERARETEFPLDEADKQFVLLQEGRENLLTGEAAWAELPATPELSRWLGKRLLAGRSEQIFAGYPVVVGERPGDDSGRTVLSPLFYVPVDLERAGARGFRALPESAFPELNVFALELLGLSREERTGLVAAVEELEEVASAPSGVARMEAWLRVLAAEGLVDPGFRLTPETLGPVGRGVSNTAVLYAAEHGPVIRNLVEDLEELAGLPAEQLRKGPPGVLFGAAQPPAPPPAEPYPVVVPSNLSQDWAVTAALRCPFTVVTGPPGTGKSQVLVNAVAAALHRGEWVLFASKNNQAVNVVFERLAAVCPEAAPLRAGARRYPSDLADSMRRALDRSVAGADSSAHVRWRAVEAELAPVYEAARQREGVERQLAAEAARYEEMVLEAPREAFAVRDPDRVEAAARQVLELLAVASSRPPFWPWARRRWSKAHRALPAAWESLRYAVEEAMTLPEQPDPRRPGPVPGSPKRRCSWQRSRSSWRLSGADSPPCRTSGRFTIASRGFSSDGWRRGGSCSTRSGAGCWRGRPRSERPGRGCSPRGWPGRSRRMRRFGSCWGSYPTFSPSVPCGVSRTPPPPPPYRWRRGCSTSSSSTRLRSATWRPPYRCCTGPKGPSSSETLTSSST